MPILSILIPTLLARKELFFSLYDHIYLQSRRYGDKIEAIVEKDDGQMSVGEKRNKLLAQATGEYVVFVDDDDLLANDYVRKIIAAIDKGHPDCIGLSALVKFKCGSTGLMVCSRMCLDWDEEEGLYTRPPCHLNPIKRSIAARVRFRHINKSEDHFWALELKRLELVKTEVFASIDPIYNYICGEPKKGL